MLTPFSLVVPAFNEADRIGATLAGAIGYLEKNAPGSEIIVVDDGSSDATADVVRGAFARGAGVEMRLIQHPAGNRGKGAAVREGLLASTRPIALFSDADFSTPLGEAPTLLDPIEAGEVEIAFGSRALNRRLIGHRQSWYREQGGRVFNLLVRLMTGLPFWDTQCGFKAFRMEAFRPVLEQTTSNGFGFDVEFLYLARQAGLRLREVAVRWDHNDGSKVDYVNDSFRMLREVAELRRRQKP